MGTNKGARDPQGHAWVRTSTGVMSLLEVSGGPIPGGQQSEEAAVSSAR